MTSPERILLAYVRTQTDRQVWGSVRSHRAQQVHALLVAAHEDAFRQSVPLRSTPANTQHSSHRFRCSGFAQASVRARTSIAHSACTLRCQERTAGGCCTSAKWWSTGVPSTTSKRGNGSGCSGFAEKPTGWLTQGDCSVPPIFAADECSLPGLGSAAGGRAAGGTSSAGRPACGRTPSPISNATGTFSP